MHSATASHVGRSSVLDRKLRENTVLKRINYRRLLCVNTFHFYWSVVMILFPESPCYTRQSFASYLAISLRQKLNDIFLVLHIRNELVSLFAVVVVVIVATDTRSRSLFYFVQRLLQQIRLRDVFILGHHILRNISCNLPASHKKNATRASDVVSIAPNVNDHWCNMGFEEACRSGNLFITTFCCRVFSKHVGLLLVGGNEIYAFLPSARVYTTQIVVSLFVITTKTTSHPCRTECRLECLSWQRYSVGSGYRLIYCLGCFPSQEGAYIYLGQTLNSFRQNIWEKYVIHNTLI